VSFFFQVKALKNRLTTYDQRWLFSNSYYFMFEISKHVYNGNVEITHTIAILMCKLTRWRNSETSMKDCIFF
jgi:hypothetical protein